MDKGISTITLNRVANKLWEARLLVGLWLLVNVLDVAFTQILLASGMWHEFNPLLSNLSSPNMWIYKLMATGAIAVLLVTFNKISCLKLATLGIALVVIWNAINLTFIT